jgi:hypothetical protein
MFLCTYHIIIWYVYIYLSLSPSCTYYVCVIQVLTASNDHPNWIRLAYPASIVYYGNDASPPPRRVWLGKWLGHGQVARTCWESQIHHSPKWGNTAPLKLEWLLKILSFVAPIAGMGHAWWASGPIRESQGKHRFLSGAVSTAGSGSKRGSGGLPVAASASGAAGCSNGESWSRNMAQRGVGRL